MTDRIPSVAIDSLSGYIAEVLATKRRWIEQSGEDQDVWFRGVRHHALRLLPGAYWRNPCDEDSLFLSFQSMVPSYVTREPLLLAPESIPGIQRDLRSLGVDRTSLFPEPQSVAEDIKRAYGVA
jgi:hypothetical protein